MTNWKTSLYGQIIYMAVVGAGFIFIPGLVAGLLHLGPSEEVWIRILGVLALVLCTYYYAAIQNDAVWFARVSVWGRYGFSLGVIILALLFDLPMLIAVALLEAALAIWTQLSFRMS